MFKPKIKISDELYRLICKAADLTGCESPEIFCEQVLAKEVQRIMAQIGKKELSEAEIQDIESKLQGLGYLD